MKTPPPSTAGLPVPPIPASLSDWEALIAAFEAGSLPWASWRHPQHLAVTLWYVRRQGIAQTASTLPDRIRAFNAAHGVETTIDRGYHESMTRFWLALVGDFWAHADQARDPIALLADLDRALGDKELPFAYWSRELLLGWDARRGWVPPDLRPFPQADLLPVA
jgi:hypothetical protein